MWCCAPRTGCVWARGSRPGFPPDRLLYYGESLGAAVVTELATEHPPAGLVLRSPTLTQPSLRVGDRVQPGLVQCLASRGTVRQRGQLGGDQPGQ